MNTGTLAIKVTPEAVQDFQAIPPHIRQHLIQVIRDKAPRAGEQMIVVSWTMDGTKPHIYRAMKDYRYPPGWRIIFHRCPDKITIDRVARRDCDPYQDGH